MTLILALGLVWLLLATVVAVAIGRAIRFADGPTAGNSGLDRLLVDARQEARPLRAARAGFDSAGFDRAARTV